MIRNFLLTRLLKFSYLRNEEQQVLLQYMSNHNMVPSMKQAKELKQISKERMLTYSEIDQICMNESTEKVQGADYGEEIETIFSRYIYKDSDGRNYIYASGIVGRKRG